MGSRYGRGIGDPAKLAEALARLAALKKPPLRLVSGFDAGRLRWADQRRAEDDQSWQSAAPLSTSRREQHMKTGSQNRQHVGVHRPDDTQD